MPILDLTSQVAILTLIVGLISQVVVNGNTGNVNGASRTDPCGVRRGVPVGVYAAGAFEPVTELRRVEGRQVRPVERQGERPSAVGGGGDRRRYLGAGRDGPGQGRGSRAGDAAPGGRGRAFVPVEFTGLTVTPYVNQAGRLAYSLKAAGIRAPGGAVRRRGQGGGGMKSGAGRPDTSA